MSRTLRILIGVTLCAALGAAPWWMLNERADAHVSAESSLAALWTYWTQSPERATLRLSEPAQVRVGDPIITIDAAGLRRQVGEVIALEIDGQLIPDRLAWATGCRARWYPIAPDLSHVNIAYHQTPTSFVWVVETLFTPERQELIRGEIRRALDEHREEIAAAFRPVLQQSLVDFGTILGEEWPQVVARHRPELEAIAARYRLELLDAEVLPWVSEELWPIVRTQAEPEAREVGRELWDRLSLWRFGWRMAYDSLPLVPEKKLTEAEWSRFVEQEAMPVIRAHTDQFIAVISEILRSASQDPKLQETLRKALLKATEDPELQQLARTMTRELLTENARLREYQKQRLASPEARRAMELASDRLEPTIRALADQIFGTEFTGLTPEFVRVLRNQILHKDQRWFVVTVDPAAENNPRSPLPVLVSHSPPPVVGPEGATP